MTSRERVLAAVNHQEPDRLPIDCGAMRSTGIQAIAYNQLKKHLGITTGHTRVYDIIQQLAEPEEWYLDRFHIDAINGGREFMSHRWKDWTLPDGSPAQVPLWLKLKSDGEELYAIGERGLPVAHMAPGTTYFSQTLHPLADDEWMESLKNLAREMRASVCWAALPEPIYEEGLSDANIARMVEHLRCLRQTHDRAIMLAFGANLFEWATFLRRMDNFLLDLKTEPARAEALLDKLVEIHLGGIDKLLPAVREHIDLIQLGDDLGTQMGPIMSPAMYRKFFKPRHRIITQRIKQLAPNVKVFLHCCGGVYPLIHDLAEAGFEVLNPVQIAARDMGPAKLKSEFGNEIAFWGGGCDTQEILPRGTPQQVKDHVRRNIDILAPGGGFIFAQVHNILAEVPPENVVAMYEAAMG